jgi:MYXO-CTERM domain-containing protein
MTRRFIPTLLASAFLILTTLCTVTAKAGTLSVGPGMTYTTIMDAWKASKPGDVIEVQGGQTYTGTFLLDPDHSGTKDAPITMRGIKVNGARPILKGIGPGQYDNMVVFLNASYFTMESFEIVGNDNDTDYCLVHAADQVTLRDLVVHDCLHQAGLVGNDTGSGSLLLEYSELFHNGNGEYSHQIYMATDQAMYPGATFRMQFNYVHNGVGGNNVASRSERNEIYYNWIEGAFYHELDLTGPDVGGTPRRCDSDVVGNVFRRTTEWRVARIGGDGSGDSMGRFRFVNNTMMLDAMMKSAITLQLTVSTLEMYNNVIIAPQAGIRVYEVDEQMGPDATQFGKNNWIVTGMTSVPAPWTGTIMGADPGIVDPSMYDYRPTMSSPLVGAGTTDTAMPGALAFVNPLMAPAYNPPQRRLIAIGSAEKRTFTGNPSIGAFEPTAAAPGPPVPDPGPPPTVNGTAGGPNGGSSGCGCRASASSNTPWSIAGIALVAIVGARRRRNVDR